MPVDGFSEPYALSLGGKRRGNIWQHKPEVGEDGLMLVVHNGKLVHVYDHTLNNIMLEGGLGTRMP